MPLWSLTQERVEKLRRQIGEKETEIDNLIKLSKEDIWKKDLDDFLAEWRFQLEEEERREKKVASMGRRASTKLMTGGGRAPAAKKRKALGDDPDDEDYAAPKSKKSATVKKVQPKGGLLDYLNKASEKPANKAPHDGADDRDDDDNDGDDDDFEAEILPKKNRGAPKAKEELKKEEKREESDEEVKVSAIKTAPKAESQGRANRKPVKYAESSDSDSDNCDALLDDVSKMVKGIGDGNSASDTRTLFSERSRPGSSAGLKTTAKLSKATSDFDPDDTDYSKLVPQQTPRRSLQVKSKDAKIADDDDSQDRESAKPDAPKSKAAAKAKPTAASTAKSGTGKPRGRPKKDATKEAPPAAAKKTQSVPAAKGKAKKKLADDLSDDDIDAMANDILDSPAVDKSDDDDVRPARSRPSRRAAATAKKPTYVIDDDDSEMSEPADEDSGDDFEESD